MTVTIPNLTGLTQAAAVTALAGAGLTLGKVGYAPYSGRPINTVTGQDPVGGMRVPAGTAVNVAITQLTAPFDPLRSVISQYANSATILRLITNMDQYVDNRANMQNFYDFVWNVDTAQGFGLDIWGKIVGVSRLVKLRFDEETFGFQTATTPSDWEPFNQGTFWGGPGTPDSYLLPDSTYRLLVLTKAMANITATTAPAMNQVLQNLFPTKRVYVMDLGNMQMLVTFEADLTLAEWAVVAQSGAFLKPAGVLLTFAVVPPSTVFGFSEMGGTIQPFNQGVFYSTPAGA